MLCVRKESTVYQARSTTEFSLDLLRLERLQHLISLTKEKESVGLLLNESGRNTLTHAVRKGALTENTTDRMDNTHPTPIESNIESNAIELCL